MIEKLYTTLFELNENCFASLFKKPATTNQTLLTSHFSSHLIYNFTNEFEIFDFRIEFLQFATFCYIWIRRDCHLIEWPKWNSSEIGKFQYCRWWRCWYFFQYQMQTKSFRQGTIFNCWMVVHNCIFIQFVKNWFALGNQVKWLGFL